MDFEDVRLPKDMEGINRAETEADVLDINRYNIELDFVEQYEDANGILHVKTFFNHDEMAESDLWEVFIPENGAHSLELLLKND